MPVLRFEGVKYDHGSVSRVNDNLTVEEALSVSINGVPFTITMRTPGFENELVTGLLFTEDIYTNRTIFPKIEITQQNDLGYVTAVNVVLDESLIQKPYRNSRTLLSVSSCGICGKTELEPLHLKDLMTESKEKLKASLVPEMFEKMNLRQSTFQQSGGSHAAAAFSMEGEMLAVMEDIGRHNAVDKVIGSLVLQSKLKKAICLVVSGRISYEIVSKCFCAGIPFLAAVSAPSSMAVDYARELGITLMGFCRADKFTVYSHPGKIDHTEGIKEHTSKLNSDVK